MNRPRVLWKSKRTTGGQCLPKKKEIGEKKKKEENISRAGSEEGRLSEKTAGYHSMSTSMRSKSPHQTRVIREDLLTVQKKLSKT